MQCKQAGTYRPLTKDDKKGATKREIRKGRKVVTPQVNYTRKEWTAKKRKEAETRAAKEKKHAKQRS